MAFRSPAGSLRREVDRGAFAGLATANSKLRPRVALIQGCITQAQQPHAGVSYYGLPIRESLPTALDANELFDGAMTMNTTRGIGYYPTTWDWQNHPLALALHREQGQQCRIRRRHFVTNL
jgi:hypothetical protein